MDRMTRLLPLTLPYAFLLLGCRPSDRPEPRLATHIRVPCVSQPGDDDFYFPSETIEPQNEVVDRTEQERYSQFLAAVSAPSLSCDGTFTEAYRFLWLPSYRPAAIVVVQKIVSEWKVEAVELDHPRTNHPLRVIRRRERMVTQADIGRLLAELARAEFWTGPAVKNSLASDGATRVIEGRLGTAYRVVSRPNPTDPSFRLAGRAFFDIAGMVVPPEADYWQQTEHRDLA